jgi:hypothetical protein
MAMNAYTRFPPLVADAINVDDCESAPRYALSVQGSEHDLLRAWASILSRYTGYDDKVTFASDEGSVTVSLAEGTISKEPWTEDGPSNIPLDATALYVKPVSEHEIISNHY